MSLINDVLRDLEKRQPKAGDSSERQVPAVSRRGRPARWALWLAAAAFTGGALHWTLDRHPFPDTDAATRLIPETLPAASSPATQGPAAQTAATQAPLRHPESIDAQAQDSAVAAPVPVDDSSMPPAQPEPSAIQAAMPLEAPIEADPERPASGAASTTAVGTEPAPAAGNAIQAGDSQGPNITIERANPPQDDIERALDAGRRSLARGRFEVAETQLRRLLESHPGLTEAHELLARSLVGQARVGAALTALEAGLGQAERPTRLAALAGRLLMERGENDHARAILLEHTPEDVAADPDYHLLLAASHRQAGDHEAAAAAYRAISEAVPGNAAAWIGLGVSMEALGVIDQAAAAYEQAAAAGDRRAAAFARQRLQNIDHRSGDRQ